MANAIVKHSSGYSVEMKNDLERGKYLVSGGTKPYIVTLIEGWKGARCSCPQGLYRSRRTGVPCKHEKIAREAVATVAQVRGSNPQLSINF